MTPTHLSSFASLRAGGALVFFLALAGCSGSSDNPVGGTGDDAGGGHTASPDSGAPHPDGGHGGTPDAAPEAGPVVPPFVSNPANVTVRDDTPAPKLALTLVSSNLTQSPSGSDYYQEWYAEVMNTGNEVICYPQVDAKFLDSASATVIHFNAFADADPYKNPQGTLNLVSSCLKPGAVGVFWSNNLGAAVSINTVATLSVTFSNLSGASSYVPHPDSPKITAAMPQPDLGPTYYALAGTAVNGPALINNVELKVYPKSAAGLVIGHLAAFHMQNYNAGESWSFKTDDVESAFTQYHAYLSFIDGPMMAKAPERPELPPLEQARQEFLRERTARADAARASAQ